MYLLSLPSQVKIVQHVSTNKQDLHSDKKSSRVHIIYWVLKAQILTPIPLLNPNQRGFFGPYKAWACIKVIHFRLLWRPLARQMTRFVS